jgi:hypothetical protein
MRRREFLATLGLLPFIRGACAPAARSRPVLALASADTESHVAVLDAHSGRVRGRVATLEGPRSIEAAGGQALVAHTDAGALTLLEGRPVRVRRVLRDLGEPRYTAVAPDGIHAYVTDSSRGELVVLDLERGRIVGGGEVGARARHVTIAPDGQTLWVALGTKAQAVAVVDLSHPRRPRVRGLLQPPFLAHDVACSPGGRRLWISSGNSNRLALYSPGAARPLALLHAGLPPQHVSFGAGRAYVASGDSGSLAVQHTGDGRTLARTRVPRGSYNVQHGAGMVITPSLEDGTVTIAGETGRTLSQTRIAAAAHDACLIV